METTRIKLFGGLRLYREGEEISRLPSQKMGLLLAYLTLKAGKPQPREHLIELLWPEGEIEAGRNNLSTHLSLLRRLMEPDKLSAGTVLKADRQEIRLCRESIEADTLEFEALQGHAARTTAPTARLSLLQQAATLAEEELLPGVYEDWALEARSHYAEQVQQVYRERIRLLLSLERFTEAREDAVCLLRRDDCDSEACRFLMLAAAGAGHPEAAMQTYDRLAQALARNFDATPDPEVQALRERIRREPDAFLAPSGLKMSAKVLFPPAPAVPQYASRREIAEPPLSSEGEDEASASVPQERTFASGLPHLLTRFFGREQEQADLIDLLLMQEGRLVTVLGAGGAGKTRLALEIAHRLAPKFAGRVIFVPLADIASSALMPLQLMNTLRLPMTPGDPLEKVIFALAEKPTLLILDNMEHLLNEEGAKSENPLGSSGRVMVKRLLESMPTLRCLVTSRQALHLTGEQEYYLPPLALPAAESRESLPLCASVALYVDRAQKAKADFALTAHNAKAIAALCRKLEGMPLAVEMAAAWIKTLPPARMLERLERQLEVLVSRRRDLPARQTSMRATCEWSYGQLPPELQAAFVRLSVFQGGWTLEAAEALMGGEALDLLAELQERSLLLLAETEEEETRYRMLEPLREFAAEKLEERREQEVAQHAHAHLFLEMAQKAGESFRTPEEKEWFARLKREQDNLRAALRWCEQKEAPEALRLLVPLTRFWKHSGSLVEGSGWCARILALSGAQERTPARAQALYEAGNLEALQTDYTRAKAYLKEAFAIFAEHRDRFGQAGVLNGLGCTAVFERSLPEAREYFCQGLAIGAEEGLEREVASCCHGLGNVEMLTGNYQAAQVYFERALAIRQRFQDELGSAYTQGALAQLAREQNRNEEALRHYRAILDSFHRAGVAWTVALTLQHISHIFQSLEKWSQTACLLGGANTLREATGYRLPPANREEQDRNVALLRAKLGEQAFEQAWKEGAVMTEARMVAYAIERIASL